MISPPSRIARCVVLALTFMAWLGPATPAMAVEIGQPAPDFRLTATTGGQISLTQFRGKQVVLIEFYSADFAPV